VTGGYAVGVASDSLRRTVRLTAPGAATRNRILDAAAELMWVRGVAATTLDDVRSASGVSKSQLYHHFSGKKALIAAVVERRSAEVLEREQRRLGRLDSIRGLERWRDAIVQGSRLHDGAYGCVLGSMANELASQDEDARLALAHGLGRWEDLLVAGLSGMRDKGVLRPVADPEQLGTALMAALQGGYLLAQTARDTRPIEVALDLAIAHVRSLSPSA
jgi:TetR/AcrR family transcriptional repressor of nem operon